MKNFMASYHDKGTPIDLLEPKKSWVFYVVLGAIFWLVALVFWWQKQIDANILFYFTPARLAYTPLVALSQWLSSYGMATITGIFVLYLLLSQKLKSLDAPLTIYFYTICSYGLISIVGDLLKFVFARPRPINTFGNEIVALSQSLTPALPSGHATKSIALILPFILLIHDSKKIHKVIKVLISLIAGGVCMSRIALGAHYFSDVVAGLGIALIGFPISIIFANMVLKKGAKEKLPILSKIWGGLLIFLTIVFMVL